MILFNLLDALWLWLKMSFKMESFSWKKTPHAPKYLDRILRPFARGAHVSSVLRCRRHEPQWPELAEVRDRKSTFFTHLHDTLTYVTSDPIRITNPSIEFSVLHPRQSSMKVAWRRRVATWSRPASPASYHIELRDLAAAGRRVTTCIEGELDLERPASIHG
ncbi:hypothetical protein EDB81DRAFT_220521 [Dactylonectria macrodidyma]|uniref:Uncharacterized protein n=1 Tax=Dactylonectria macrodidyma TaxID=307937 RepID=A0A9P9IL53_9HYPO|nr:hypothetical protein EDB81DRAFT_220521 [Dactylonectria macrodidyma]